VISAGLDDIAESLEAIGKYPDALHISMNYDADRMPDSATVKETLNMNNLFAGYVRNDEEFTSQYAAIRQAEDLYGETSPLSAVTLTETAG